MECVPELAAAGVTDFRINTSFPPDTAHTTDIMTALASSFRDARAR